MSNSDLDTDEVAAIYDELLKTYRTEWEYRGHRSLHLSYYDDEHDEPAEAAMNTMRVLSEAAGIDGSEHILNIGCGAGEDSVWNARAYGAEVTGVNISETQLGLARENAAEHGVTERTRFNYDDFHDLDTIEDDSVDVVWGLEALSHSSDRARALAAANRVLRSDGRVAFTDLFLTGAGEGLSAAERERVETINDALGLRIGAIDEFERTLSAAGFEGIRIDDLTDGIKPCTERRRSFARIAHPVGRLLSVVGVVSETQLDSFRASAEIDRLIDAGVLGYYLVTADVSE
ncbi:methyltransferase domain-containing protein [Halovenus sp. WSH3]|uniref:Methyltransferase domain-containing protein n=1 Tax=Halovenus carboxidivorans TaxID=2692199 RepID=A0A6B0T262_9EURY|nr:methyltransferase domain-containing protein [Halovenus carboxidivorans]MXR52154.1 methyltransferase domain-containing protein [Halovenus carboxidivorans]